MANEYSRLSSVVGLWVACVFFYFVDVGSALWVGFMVRGFALVLFGAAIVSTIDFILYRAADRIRELGSARVYPATQLAYSLKGLTGQQVELVRAFNTVDIEMIIENSGPLFMVVCLTRKVPWDDVEDYLLLSQSTPGFLYPISHYTDWRKAQAIKDLIVAKGWAKESAKLGPAQLTKPLAWIAARFGVELRGMSEDLDEAGLDTPGELDI